MSLGRSASLHHYYYEIYPNAAHKGANYSRYLYLQIDLYFRLYIDFGKCADDQRYDYSRNININDHTSRSDCAGHLYGS